MSSATTIARGRAFRVATLLLTVVVVAGAWLLLQLYGLGLAPFHSHGEPREAVVVQDLVREGNWILPKRNGEQLPRKPPLFYWLAAVAARVHGGVDETSVRLPSAVLSGAAAVLVSAVANAFYGPLAGILSGIVLLSSFEWLRAATAARVDMTLAFGLTLSFLGLTGFRAVERRLWLVLFYAGAAWATLSKGIPGLVIPALAVLLVCIVADRSLAFAWRMRPILGTAIVLGIAAIWYAAAAAQGGREFVSIVVRENVVRVVAGQHGGLGHVHSLTYLLVMLLLGLLPWTLLLPSTALALWHDRRAIDRWDARVVALLWSLAVLAPYSVAASKRGVYLLPLYPAVAMLVGWWAQHAVQHRVAAPRIAQLLAAVAWLGGAALGGLALLATLQALGIPSLTALAALLEPRAAVDVQAVAAAADLRLAAYLAAAATAAVIVACTVADERWPVALPALVGCTVAAIIAVRTVILPAIGEAHTRRDFAAAVRRAVVDPAAVRTWPSLDYGTLFYWGAPLPVFDPDSSDPPPQYLLLPESAWQRMAPALRRQYRALPGLSIDHDRDQGYESVIQRIDEAAGQMRQGRSEQQ